MTFTMLFSVFLEFSLAGEPKLSVQHPNTTVCEATYISAKKCVCVCFQLLMAITGAC